MDAHDRGSRAGRHDGGRPAARRALRAALLGAGLMGAALEGGCVHGPRSPKEGVPAPHAAMPAGTTPAGSDAMPTVSVDMTRGVGESTAFHKTASDRQRFQVHVDFGKVFESQGNLERALQEYQDALKVAEGRRHGDLHAGDEALAHRRIAATLDRLGQFRQSEPHYHRAQKLAPKDSKVWNDAGYSYYLQARFDEAEKALRTALKLSPTDERARTNLGMVLGAAGKTQEALSLLSATQGDAVGHANLGYLLASTGQYGRARQEYETARSMRSDLPVVQQALAQLDRQERGVASPSAETVAKAGPPARPDTPAGKVDADVARTSAEGPADLVPPPLPPLPPARPGFPE